MTIGETIAVWLCGATAAGGLFCAAIGQFALKQANATLADAEKYYRQSMQDTRRMLERAGLYVPPSDTSGGGEEAK